MTLLFHATVLAAALWATEDPVLATYSGGGVRQSELERERAFLTRDEQTFRSVKGHDEAKAERDWLQRIALRAVARDRVLSSALGQDPELREVTRQPARQFLLNLWHERCYDLPLVVPSEAELRAELGPFDHELPPRLKLSHIFRRAETDEALAAARSELEALRPTISSLDAFRALAAKISDSETRRREGRLGWLRQGMLPRAAEDALFRLAVGTISPPLTLRGGVHLFYVEGQRPAEKVAIDKHLERLRQKKLAEARNACRSDRLAKSAIPWRGVDGALEVGSWRMPVATIREHAGRPGEDAEATLQRYREDEQLYQDALVRDVPTAIERARLPDLENNVYLSRWVEAEAAKTVGEPSEDDLRRFFEQAAYVRPRHLAGRVLKTERDPGVDPLRFFADLESLAEELGSGTLDFGAARARLVAGATFEEVPLLPQIEVAGWVGPLVFEAIKDARPPQVIGPIQDGADFVIVQLSADEAARPLTFAEGRERARDDWRKERIRAAKAAVLSQLLTEIDLRFITPQAESR